jgi:CBS domain-containing protein
VTVKPDDTVEQAARLMYHLQVKRLPVVDAGGYLVVIVSRADLLTVFDRPDQEIRAEIVDDVVLHEFLIDPSLFIVTVADGVVTVTGPRRPRTWATASWTRSATFGASWPYTTSSATRRRGVVRRPALLSRD